MPADPARHRQPTDHHLQQADQATMAQPLAEHQRPSGQRTDPFQAMDIVLRRRSRVDIEHGKPSL
ncbi:hypothetical protein D3C76_1640610 [compost metagenome]